MRSVARKCQNKASSTKSGSFFGSQTPFFQAKLTVNQPGDAHEQQADAVADQVMRMQEGDAPIVQRTALMPVGSLQRQAVEPEKEEMAVQRKCADCEQEEMAQRKETGGDAGGQAAPGIVNNVLSSGGGHKMDTDTQGFMESRFGQDFSDVRVHTDNRAAESASAIQALAYTSGKDIVFGQGEYQPATSEGQRLLAHELVHVGQQGGVKRKMIQRSAGGATAGGIIGGLLGAGLGIGIGAAAGGVGGAIAGGIIGGLVGTFAGMIIGDSESAGERGLNSDEERELRRVFGGSLNYGEIKISFNAPIMTAGNYARTPHNTVYFPAEEAAEAQNKTQGYFTFLVHEITHVWQHQHGISVGEKLGHAIRGSSAYEYGGEAGLRQAQQEGRHFGDFNTEQQGDICADYYRIITGQRSGDRALYEYFIREVQSGTIIRSQATQRDELPV